MAALLAVLPGVGPVAPAAATAIGDKTKAVGGGAASGGIGLPGILTGGVGLIQGIGAIASGFQQQAQAKAQAAQFEAQAAEELAIGSEKARQNAQEARRVAGAQAAIFAANGLDLGTGTPADVGLATVREADRRSVIARRNAARRASTARARGRGLLAEAKGALTGGVTKALGIGLQTFEAVG